MKRLPLLRGLLAAAVLAGVGAASLLDGSAADLVAGGDGEWFARPVGAAPALRAQIVPKLRDPSAARLKGSCLPSAPAGLAAGPAPTLAIFGASFRGRALSTNREPRTPRAPPRG